jgi:FAD/FMN-containing dehydrogenase
MNERPAWSRRRWLQLATASAVVAFDPQTRRWIGAAEARESSPAQAACWRRVPALDGELAFDAATLAAAADDFGHIVHALPQAVLRPGSARDVQRLIRFANREGLTLSMRGQGHSTHGQSQAEAGVVIDSRTLASIEIVTGEGADGPSAIVGGGARWIDVLTAALEHGLTPPVLTDFIELSVGGTLSGGGIGGATHRHGLQVNNVLELEVITGRGERLTCSPSRNAELFDAVRGGLGQLAIIVRATLSLAPAPAAARVYQLFYSSLPQFLADQRLAARSARFDYLEGQALAQPDGSFQFMIEAAAYYTQPATPDDAALLAGFSPLEGSTIIEEHTYFDWANRLEPLITELRATGAFDLPHPWFDVFLPDDADDYLTDVFANLVADDVGGPILLYPFARDAVRGSLVALPATELVFLFDLLRFSPPDPAVVERLITDNRTLFEAARELGAKRYPIGSIPFSPADWVEHFGASFAELAALKATHDPNNVLTPGQRIFL